MMISNFKNKIPVLSDNIEFNKLNETEFILSNLKHRHYLKINQNTYNLLSLINNGSLNFGEIQNLFNNKYNEQISLLQLEYLFYHKLSKYGVLKGEEEIIKPFQKPSYLKLSFIIFNERFISKIAKHFNFLFQPKTALLTILGCISIISFLTVVNYDVYKNFSIQESLVFFFLIMLVSSTLHEFGHVASANYFGAKHGGIGGGFYLFTPVYFADVTDIWRLSKWQRVVVNLSGMYFEIIFCTIIAIIGFFANKFIITVIAVIVCVNTLLNLNPFLRSDGYWILSDLLNKPNLLHHSFEKLKDFISVLRGKKVEWLAMDYFLLLYGILSYFIIGFFLYYVLFENSNSFLKFPMNLIKFIKKLFTRNSEINLVEYGELVIPLIFYTLLFRVFRVLIIKIYERICLPIRYKSNNN